MNRKLICLSSAAFFILALVISGEGEAQQPPGKGPKGKKGPGFAQSITADQIVERIMSFDKNDDGKITADELPERMQHLIALGDVNKDGALDKEEIRKLAGVLEAFTSLASANGPGNGPGGPKGFGPKGGGPKGPLKGAVKGANEVQRTVEDLNLTGPTRDKTDRLIRNYQEKVRLTEEMSRAELVLAMKDVLNEADYRVFKSAVDFQTGPPAFKGPRPDDLNTRIDQLQKELDDLRTKLPK